MRLAHELERGRTYSVVVTTGGGLYRYRLGDLVNVVGFEAGCPLLRFVGREEASSTCAARSSTTRSCASAFGRYWDGGVSKPCSGSSRRAGTSGDASSYALFLELGPATRPLRALAGLG